MGWNDPGGGRDPWGRKSGSGSWDLDAHIRNLWRRARRFTHGAPPSKHMTAVVAMVAIAVWLMSGIYMVPQGSRAVLLVFGREVRIVGPGAHWRWPQPFATDDVVNVERIHVVTIGYRQRPKSARDEARPVRASVLTAGQDIVDLAFAVQYRVKNPQHYLFSVDHPRKTVAEAAETAMREAVAHASLSAILSRHQHRIEYAARMTLQHMLDTYHAGIVVVALKIQKAAPPKAVENTFGEVIRARQDRDRLKSEADAYAAGILPKATGEANALIDNARAYRATVIARAKGRIARFDALATAYAQAPVLTRERLFIDATSRVFKSAPKVFVTAPGQTIIHLPRSLWAAPLTPAPSPP